MTLTVDPGLGAPGYLEPFLGHLAEGDEPAAVGLLTGAATRGIAAERLLLDVVAPAQRRVGELWASGQWDVAREHAATAISERAVAAVAEQAPPRPHRGRITVACVEGEWHALPSRLVAEVLRSRGWRVDFLGANVPGPHLISHLHRVGPDAVALSCSLFPRLPKAHALITACQAAAVPVVAGGRGFGPGGRYSTRLGADAWAPDAAAAADLLERPLEHRGLSPYEALDHLADEEYTQLVLRRPMIISTVMEELPRRLPDMAGYSARRREATAEDLGHLMDFLAAALYVDDTSLFTAFTSWTADVLAARSVPPHALVAGLEGLHDRLADFPRSSALLMAGADAVRAGADGSAAPAGEGA